MATTQGRYAGGYSSHVWDPETRSWKPRTFENTTQGKSYGYDQLRGLEDALPGGPGQAAAAATTTAPAAPAASGGGTVSASNARGPLNAWNSGGGSGGGGSPALPNLGSLLRPPAQGGGASGPPRPTISRGPTGDAAGPGGSGAASGAPPAPGPVGSAPPAGLPSYSAPEGVDYGRAESSLDALKKQLNIGKLGRETLGGPAENNEWERMALEAFGEGFDPGSGQFVGKELADEIMSAADVNQMAQQRAAGTIRAFKDAERQFADAASLGGSFSPARMAALKARASIEGAGALQGATRDAQLEAKRLNAEQAARSAANQRENFASDLAARLGLGRLGLDSATQAGTFGTQRRGMDQERDLARYSGDITQRGQDYERSFTEAGLNNQRALARAQGEQNLAGERVRERLGIGQLELGARGQDLAARGQDMDYTLGAGRLNLDQYRTQADLFNASQERANRLEMLDRQLADSGLDRASREKLETERLQVQREAQALQERMNTANLGQRESEFSRDLDFRGEALDQSGEQFDRDLTERGRQFDTGLSSSEQQRRLDRELGAYESAQNRRLARDQWSDNARRDVFQAALGGLLPDVASGAISMDDLIQQLQGLYSSFGYGSLAA